MGAVVGGGGSGRTHRKEGVWEGGGGARIRLVVQ